MPWQPIRASKGRGVVHIKKTFIIFLDKNYKSYDRATSKNHLQYGSKYYAHMAHFVRKSFRALLDEILIRPLNVLLNYAGLSLLKSPIEGNLVVSKRTLFVLAIICCRNIVLIGHISPTTALCDFNYIANTF